MTKKEICWVCKKEKKPYIVFMNDDVFNYLAYEQAREKGPICERCDKYFAMTGEFKDATHTEFQLAEESRKFANKMLEWWEREGVLKVDEDNLQDWVGIETIAKWYRESESIKWQQKIKKAEQETNDRIKKQMENKDG